MRQMTPPMGSTARIRTQQLTRRLARWNEAPIDGMSPGGKRRGGGSMTAGPKGFPLFPSTPGPIGRPRI